MCTPAASIARSLSTMIRSSAGDRPARMEARAGRRDPVAAVRDPCRQPPASRHSLVSPISIGRHLLRARWRSPRGSPASAAAATGRYRSRCMPITRTGRSPISSSAITAPRGSSIGRSIARDIDHVDMPLHQQGIAVPAEVAGVDLEQSLGLLAAREAAPACGGGGRRTGPACTAHARRSARAAPPRRGRRCACPPPAARPRRHRFPAARGARAAGRRRRSVPIALRIL